MTQIKEKKNKLSEQHMEPEEGRRTKSHFKSTREKVAHLLRADRNVVEGRLSASGGGFGLGGLF